MIEKYIVPIGTSSSKIVGSLQRYLIEEIFHSTWETS